jgi:hypothetical protein
MFEGALSILIVHFATSSSPLIKLRHIITKQRAVSARVAANNADSRATRLLHFAINDAAARKYIFIKPHLALGCVCSPRAIMKFECREKNHGARLEFTP